MHDSIITLIIIITALVLTVNHAYFIAAAAEGRFLEGKNLYCHNR